MTRSLLFSFRPLSTFFLLIRCLVLDLVPGVFPQQILVGGLS